MNLYIRFYRLCKALDTVILSSLRFVVGGVNIPPVLKNKLTISPQTKQKFEPPVLACECYERWYFSLLKCLDLTKAFESATGIFFDIDS